MGIIFRLRRGHLMVHHRYPGLVAWFHVMEVDFIVPHAHVHVVHHRREKRCIATVIFHDDVKHDLISKVVTLCVNEHKSCTEMADLLRRDRLDFEFEEFIGLDIL